MSPRISEILDRIAVLPNILRVRAEDARRVELNGGANGDLIARQEALVTRLEQIVGALEATI
jgi:hypothetical protein